MAVIVSDAVNPLDGTEIKNAVTIIDGIQIDDATGKITLCVRQYATGAGLAPASRGFRPLREESVEIGRDEYVALVLSHPETFALLADTLTSLCKGLVSWTERDANAVVVPTSL